MEDGIKYFVLVVVVLFHMKASCMLNSEGELFHKFIICLVLGYVHPVETGEGGRGEGKRENEKQSTKLL